MLSLSEDAFYQLKRLNSGSYGPYWLDPKMGGLLLELNYLKMIGYIKFDRDPKVRDTGDLSTGGHPDDDLSRYISVTPLGREFVCLREQVLGQQALRSI
jgi:hypothetical protein